MTPILERLQSEQRFHDEQADERSEAYRTGQADLRFTDDAYLDHETWVRPAFAKLGDLRGKRVLDFGCGHGMAAVVMARAGACVDAFDLSPGYVAETKRRADANGVRVNAVVANGEELPYSDATFDAVWGCAILHHLDLPKAAAELHRVLKPGGVAIFCEPWGGNPLLSFARRFLPYPGKQRTPDERPLVKADLVPLRAAFPGLTVQGFQFLEMIRRVSPKAGRLLRGTDRVLIRTVPSLKNWCRYLVVTLSRG
ncbi:class I SAM-dependent methyltransferase [Limnoglobus roseus]|uniref:Methyltransferase n=1 Tax=Limnoglobus roseus TaxID=2598579 RepID=A0A5C1AFL1_9BACT|nr:class I SAM-dependent methyltransferase [Limnoglobus roseus]QEL16522.1 methyltransferase [Limnoglobus roseus]